LGEIAEVGTGSSNGNEGIENGKYPRYVRSKFIKSIDTFEFDEDAIVIPGEGGVGEI
jgi:type I restriction enzyme, S subunit